MFVQPTGFTHGLQIVLDAAGWSSYLCWALLKPLDVNNAVLRVR